MHILFDAQGHWWCTFFLVTWIKEKKNHVLTKDIPRGSVIKANGKLEGSSWSTIRWSTLVALNFASTYAYKFNVKIKVW